MKTLGVTGGIGAGKSTVCRLLEALGARVFYADAEAKRLMVADPDARAAIMAAFGPESYHPDGQLNRAHLAARAFGDPDRLAVLNGIVHPRVRSAFEQAKAGAAADGVRLFVYEAALIFETGGDRRLDAVAVVDAPLEVRIRRVMARDDATREQVLARIRHQLPPEELRRRADYVIDNGGDAERLRERVEAVYQAALASTTD